jgi:hypothetical protein
MVALWCPPVGVWSLKAVFCRFLKREEKAACIFLYVGGVKISKKIG